MADSRVRISVDALSQEIAEMNNCLEKRRDGAQACIKAVEAYCGETNLTGEAYSNSKDYFNTTHIPLLKQIVYLCDEIIDANNSILPKFSQYVPDTRGFDADTSVLEEEIRRLKAENSNFIARIEDQRLSSRPTPLSNYNLGLQGWYDGQITINNHIIDELQKIVDGMRAFNSHCAGIYDDINALLDQLKAGIQQLNSQSVWNSEAKRFVISTEMLTKLAEIEYEKMIIHNPDGSIGLDRDYVSRVLQQEALQGSPTEIEATYLALEKTFETISSDDDIEYFLNACYIKRQVPYEEISKYRWSTGSSDEYFHRQVVGNEGIHFDCSLSPVFLGMMNHYYDSGRIADAFQILCDCEYVDKMVNERNLLQRVALLEHMFNLGDDTYAWQPDYQPFHPISIKTTYDDKILMSIDTAQNNGVEIVQYPYSRAAANNLEGKDILMDYAWSIGTPDSAESVIRLAVDAIIGTLTKDHPIIAGGIYVYKVMNSSYEYAEQRRANKNALEAGDMTSAMGAFGVDGQICTVDGKLQFQYLNLNKKTFCRNFAAFKASTGRSDLTIDELCNSTDSDLIDKFVNFTTIRKENDAVQAVIDEIYHGNEQQMIKENINALELAQLDMNADDMYKVIGGEIDE